MPDTVKLKAEFDKWESEIEARLLTNNPQALKVNRPVAVPTQQRAYQTEVPSWDKPTIPEFSGVIVDESSTLFLLKIFKIFSFFQ